MINLKVGRKYRWKEYGYIFEVVEVEYDDYALIGAAITVRWLTGVTSGEIHRYRQSYVVNGAENLSSELFKDFYEKI